VHNKEAVLIPNNDPFHKRGKLTSEALATLIIDTLRLAKIIKMEDVDRAITISTEEIDARKAAGDY